MNLSSRLRLGLYVVSLGLFLGGIAITGFAAYGEVNLTPYMVQVDQVGAVTDESPILYSSLSSAEKALFNRVKDGGAAPAEGRVLTTFADHAVQYKGDVYAFEWTYDPTTLITIPLVFCISVAVTGGVLFALTQFAVKRRSLIVDSPA
jgi:hypothetical protein